MARVAVGGAADAISVLNIRASPFALPASQDITLGTAGTCSTSTVMQVTTGTITVIKYYPTKVEGRGPRSYSHEFKFSFVTSNGVPSGG
mmetsp:Transcript_26820/g.4839  ORF Transcript_26820/g.4839 Transcript_26820/m.4839 type:complete len:89 (-) Transcript_26820:687-953(-)